MKTKNNVQKAFLRTIAVIVSFVLISFTVSAQDFWVKVITNSSFNEIAVAMIETEPVSNPENPENGTAKTVALETVYEPSLELEKWMTCDFFFNRYLLDEKAESESPLQVEDWMLNANLFNTSTEREDSLELESWMVSSSHWNI